MTSSTQKRFFDAVRRGDLQSFVKQANLLPADSIGYLSPVETKGEEYAAVAALTLMTQAAIEGGADQFRAYDLNDIALQKLSGQMDPGEYTKIVSDALHRMIGLVRERTGESSAQTHTSAAKDFIRRNLNRTIDPQEIAGAIHVSTSYLAHLFHDIEHCSVMKYVYRERVRAAEEMLRYSQCSAQEAADYFFFSSPSHFGRVFKEETGMTPGEYRRRYRNTDR